MPIPIVKPGTPTTPNSGGAPQIPTPGGGYGNYNPSAGLYTTPQMGGAGTTNVGPGYQAGNQYGQYSATGPADQPPPWMKNPTYNSVYGTWNDFATPQPFDQSNWDSHVAAENSYGTSFGPPPPYSQGGPGTSTTGGGTVPPPQVAGPPTQEANRPSPGGGAPPNYAPGPTTPPLSTAPGGMQPTSTNPMAAAYGMTDDQWAQLMNMIYGAGRGGGPDPNLGPNYSTGGA